ncbi:hypothetical protein PHYC_02005 [Phycisphaerales bacterium]|nr:hypothetical protein PHYC_02005 [Phycisphaerales bacterium]
MSARRGGNRDRKAPGAFELPLALRPWTRFELLVDITQRSGCVQELSTRHGLDESVVCKHLKFLERLGLLEQRVDGRRRIYSRTPRAGIQWLDRDVVVSIGSLDRAMLVFHLPEEVVDRLQSVLDRCPPMDRGDGSSAQPRERSLPVVTPRTAKKGGAVRAPGENVPKGIRRAIGPG